MEHARVEEGEGLGTGLDEDDDARIADSHLWEFSYEAPKVRRGPLGLCVGTYGPL